MFLGFTDLIDGIILNMKFGGWVIKFFIIGWCSLPISCLFQKRTYKFNRDSSSAKTDFILFQLFIRSHYAVIGGIIGLLLVSCISIN
jgi:putative ABC transport system permease protein